MSGLPRTFGKYVLVQALDQGGMGVVFRAHEPAADRHVALKMIKDGENAAPEDVARFMDEARAAAALSHEGIVPVLDVGEIDGRAYFTMELMPGGSLAGRLEELRARPKLAAAMVRDVAHGLQHAHKRFVLHRDVKPANILMDGRGRPKLADFGIARRMDVEPTTSTSLAGSLPYMAPEQLHSPRDLDVAVDVYGLGAVLYEILTGQPPAAGETPSEVMRNVLEREPPSPRSLPGGARIDLDLETICLKCLRKAREERYADAASLAADLSRYLADEAIVARRPTPVEHARRMLRHHPVRAGIGATLVVSLVAVAVAALSVARSQEDELGAGALRVNAYAARALAGAARFELRELSDELARIAVDPDLIQLARNPGDEQAVATWRAHPLPARYDSMQLMDTEGGWIARKPPPDLKGQSFGWRDYFAGAAKLGRDAKRGVYVGRSYRSHADGSSRFPLSTPVYDLDGRWIGVLEAGVDTATALGALVLTDPAEPHRLAVVVARSDRDWVGGAVPDDWTVVLHEGLARGKGQAMPNRGVLAQLPLSRTDAAHVDPVPGYGGRWLAAATPVGETPFAVIVQTRYEAAVLPKLHLASRLAVAGAFAIGFAFIVSTALFVAIRRSRRRGLT
jgi:serine/threonine-protein kinase